MYRMWNVGAVRAPLASPRESRNGVRAQTGDNFSLALSTAFSFSRSHVETTHVEQHASQLWNVGPDMGEMYRCVATAILKYRQKPPITLQLDRLPITTEDVQGLHHKIETMFALYGRVQGVLVHDGLWRQWLDRHAAAFNFSVLHLWLLTKPCTGQLYYEVMKEFHAEADELGKSIMTYGFPASEGVHDWIALMVCPGP